MTLMVYHLRDFTVIADCAARVGGTIFDHQSGDMLTPEEFLQRYPIRSAGNDDDDA